MGGREERLNKHAAGSSEILRAKARRTFRGEGWVIQTAEIKVSNSIRSL
jgi:hypothetical protein